MNLLGATQTSLALAGVEAGRISAPPTKLPSSEDSLRFRAQLRPTFARRRKANHRNPTSVEKGAHRRKAPTPTRHAFAGAEASANLSPSTSLRSPEDSFRFRAQLRPEPGNRRRADYRNRNSVEKGAHRRKAPTPTRHAFAGAEASATRSPSMSPRSPEESFLFRAQLRPAAGNWRKANYRNRNSVEKGAHRRKAPAPIRAGFAGGEASAKLSPSTSPRSSEDSFRFRAQLRPAAGNRRKTNTEEPTSVEKGAHRRKAPTPTRHAFVGAEASAKRSTPTRTCSSEDSL